MPEPGWQGPGVAEAAGTVVALVSHTHRRLQLSSVDRRRDVQAPPPPSTQVSRSVYSSAHQTFSGGNSAGTKLSSRHQNKQTNKKAKQNSAALETSDLTTTSPSTQRLRLQTSRLLRPNDVTFPPRTSVLPCHLPRLRCHCPVAAFIFSFLSYCFRLPTHLATF